MVIRRFTSILLLAVWCALGTGLLAHLHNLQHEWEDRQAACSHRPHGTPDHPLHDENNCSVHAQLAAPAIADAVPVELVDVGRSFEMPLPAYLSPHILNRPSPDSCRGPPAC